MLQKEISDDGLTETFVPDAILPVQYFEALRPKHRIEAEQRLMLSILRDGIECFMKYIDLPGKRGRELFRDAEAWINSADRRTLFSFENVCEALDMNPDYVRRGLHCWKKQKLAHMAQ
jgi:hypothetical protein